jgi:N6-L-threonylcarbamoyladenine synthase
MITLGIETSCDETGASVIQNGRILSNIVSSSIPLHEKYGGVIPEIASRFHIEYLSRVTKKALRNAGITLKDLDQIAVTEEPGLPGSLITGQSFAGALSYSLNIPLVTVDHLAAHLYANFLVKNPPRAGAPFVGAVVSGGHTNIFIYKGSFKNLVTLGRTRDDAIGEAFDKVAKILGIGYPGGPRIEKYARRVRKSPVSFPRAYLDKDSFDFSLSGLKTAVLYYVKNKKLSRGEISRISWSFQEAVFDVLVDKISKACEKFKIKSVVLGGGVIANMRLRSRLESVCNRLEYKLFYPPTALCVDNAAMVAGLGERLSKKEV